MTIQDLSEAGATTVHLVDGDLSSAWLSAARHAQVAAIDTETTGLDWRESELCLIQVHVPDVGTEIVRPPRHGTCPNLAALLADAAVAKIFHHAMFDLGFFRARWEGSANNVRCTKIAAKLLWPGLAERQNLKGLLRSHLGVEISKDMQTSDWSSPTLTADQLAYAVKDVLHLVPLMTRLVNLLNDQHLGGLAEQCWSHLSTRVELEHRGIPDPFTY